MEKMVINFLIISEAESNEVNYIFLKMLLLWYIKNLVTTSLSLQVIIKFKWVTNYCLKKSLKFIAQICMEREREREQWSRVMSPIMFPFYN